jgi:single-stranded DNA-binding protein
MNDANHVEIQGRISDAGTARQFERTAKRTICIRSAREYNKKDYETWVDVALWGELASIPWLAAGVLVRVEGRLANESWKTQSGESRSKMVVVAASIVRIMEDAPQQYAPQPQTYGQYQQRYQQQPPPQAHTYQNSQWVPPQTNNDLQPPAGVIPSPGVAGGGAASSSQAGDAQPDLPF